MARVFGEAEHDHDSISDSIEDAINSAANINDSDDNIDHLAPQSEYENIRDRNIAERQQMMNELFAKICILRKHFKALEKARVQFDDYFVFLFVQRGGHSSWCYNGTIYTLMCTKNTK